MQSFLQRFGAFILGVLCGFDRVRFRGCKLQLCYPNGIFGFIQQCNIRYADFKSYAQDATDRLCTAVEGPAKQAGIYRYLNSNLMSLEETALQIAAEHNRTSGLIAVLGHVEPGQTIRWRRGPLGWWMPYLNSGTKCLHYYHYYLDPDFGLRSTRLQTWFPFHIEIGINGRKWLAQQMTKAGIDFVQKENCFTWIEDFAAAQQLVQEQLTTDWPALLDAWTQQSNPLEKTLLDRHVPYHWCAQEAEYATDIAFREPEDLQRLYPLWVHHAYGTLQSGDLLSYMNYRLRIDGTPAKMGEVKTNIKETAQGTCIRHRIYRNLLKMYDKMGSVLRVETMLKDVAHFKVYRKTEASNGAGHYMRMRKGVADMYGRAEVSAKINERYLGALATVEEKKTLAEVTKDLGKRLQWKGRAVRALNPLAADDVALLQAVSRGEFLIHGFRNMEIRKHLFGGPAQNDAAENKRLSARVTRLFRLLRGHGSIAKVPKTHRYQVTDKGRASISALLAARQADTKQLLQAA